MPVPGKPLRIASIRQVVEGTYACRREIGTPPGAFPNLSPFMFSLDRERTETTEVYRGHATRPAPAEAGNHVAKKKIEPVLHFTPAVLLQPDNSRPC